jgi:hypothetical protein
MARPHIRFAALPDPMTRARDEPVNTPEKMDALLRRAGSKRFAPGPDNLATVISLEHLLELKTRLGSEKARFDSLDEAARDACWRVPVDACRGWRPPALPLRTKSCTPLHGLGFSLVGATAARGSRCSGAHAPRITSRASEGTRTPRSMRRAI